MLTRQVARASLRGPVRVSVAPAAPAAGASLAPMRTFAASSQRHNDKPSIVSSTLPPQSPDFIRFPTPPQTATDYVPPKRGHLPVPRNVFKTDRKPGQPRDHPDIVPKTDTDKFAERAAPWSKADVAGVPPRTEKEAQRRRLAALRRKNLREALSGLRVRDVTKTTRKAEALRVRYEQNRAAALTTTQPDDERLTQSSVRAATALNTTVVRDPLRHERQAAMAQRTAEVAQAKRESRRDALMELYQMAGTFIVDEADLEKRVNEAFKDDYFLTEGYKYGLTGAENIWDIKGRPPSISQQMAAVTRSETKLYDAQKSESDRTTQRQKMVAEALTGGKMP